MSLGLLMTVSIRNALPSFRYPGVRSQRANVHSAYNSASSSDTAFKPLP